MDKQFVIGDIHGCAKTFRCMVEDILQPSNSDQIYLLGDYVNKGPSSKSVFDYIFELQKQGYQVVALMGNHERQMLDAMVDPWKFHVFIEKGGAATLKDFRVDSIRAIPDKYISFIGSLPLYVELDHWILVHAGLDFTIDNPYENEDAILNIRHMEENNSFLRGKKLVHGHVPIPLPSIIGQMNNPDTWNYFLDGGCVYPFRNGMGFLVCMELNEKKLFVKECIDEVL